MYTLGPEKKSNGCIKTLAVIGAIALVVVAIFVVAVMGATRSIRSGGNLSASRQVVYKITTNRDWGTCYGFDTTYEMPSGTSQKSVSLCDGKTSGVVDQRSAARGDFVYLSVQNDEQLAKIGCEIYVDGRLLFHTQSEGQYVIASCSGTVP